MATENSAVSILLSHNQRGNLGSTFSVDQLTIKFIFETHRQEDFVLGSNELARVSDAKIVNGRHEFFGHEDIRLGEGEEISFATFKCQALHTPGHTAESMSYAVSAKQCPDKVWAVFTGDTLFVGETGRTDLPDPTKYAENARLLYEMVHLKILPLGHQVILYPAHGSGSVMRRTFLPAFSSNAGKNVRRIGKTFGFLGEHALIKSTRCAAVNGFSLHANRYVGERERSKLEELFSYAARPSFSNKRLSLKDPEDTAGDYIYELKSQWSDGTKAVLLSREELFEKLAALIPPPYIHLSRHFGVFSSSSKWRAKIVTRPAVKKGFTL